MPEIKLRLFGFGAKASGLDAGSRLIPEGASVQQVLDDLRSFAHPNGLLARVDERHVLVLLNGKAVRGEERWCTALEEGDTLALMVLAAGGQPSGSMAVNEGPGGSHQP